MQAVDLTQGSISRALFRLAVPVMITNGLTMMYEVADAIWLGRYSEEAIAAAQVSANIINLVLMIGVGLAIAGGALIGQARGAGKPKKERLYFYQIMSMGCVLGFVSAVLIFFTVEFAIRALSVPQAVEQDAIRYLRVLSFSAPGVILSVFIPSVFRAVGRGWTPLLVSVIALGFNVVLNPFFIFGWGFVPELGAVGAAVTTVFTRTSGVLIGIYLITRKEKHFHLVWKDLRLRMIVVIKVLKVAAPAVLSQLCNAIGFIILIGLIGRISVQLYNGSSAVLNSYSIMVRILSALILVGIGVSQSVSAVVAQNMGAGHVNRARRAVYSGIVLVFFVIGIGTLILYFTASYISRVFIPLHVKGSAETAHLVVQGTRVFAHAIVTFGILFIIYGAFHGVGWTLPVMLLNVLRIYGVAIPLTWLMGLHWGQGMLGLWRGFSLANDIVLIVGIIVFYRSGWEYYVQNKQLQNRVRQT